MSKSRVSFRKAFAGIRLFGKNGPSLQKRSFTFFLFFLVAVMSGLLLILFSSGVFFVGRKECQVFLKNELGHTAGNVSQEFGILSVEGVSLSKRLTEQIEERLEADGLTPSELKNNPQLLDPLLSESVEQLISALEKNKSSGVFLTLDATVNPALATAERSRAGLFLKNMEPNILNLSTPAIRFLRGPAIIAREKHIYMLPQWQMEFTVESDDFFCTTINAATGSVLPLSRLYYWNPACALASDCEQAMLLSAPLIASDGAIIGVCGFEVSGMLFKLQNTPNSPTYTRAFAMLAPLEGGALNTTRALYAGNYTATPSLIGGFLTIKGPRKGISSYLSPDGAIYFGLHQNINLYPKDSIFSNNEWALAILIPDQELAANIMRQNRRIFILLFMLFIFSVGAAALISRRQVAPVIGALEMVKTGNVSEYEKTNIQEIDDLITFLAAQDESSDLSTRTEEMSEASTLFQDFIKNIETLSPAERSVFNLYMEGYTAMEITEILCLSINTIKTHNKRIYSKLNVTSRKELLVYVKMMREKEDQISAEDGE